MVNSFYYPLLIAVIFMYKDNGLVKIYNLLRFLLRFIFEIMDTNKNFFDVEGETVHIGKFPSNFCKLASIRLKSFSVRFDPLGKQSPRSNRDSSNRVP